MAGFLSALSHKVAFGARRPGGRVGRGLQSSEWGDKGEDEHAHIAGEGHLGPVWEQRHPSAFPGVVGVPQGGLWQEGAKLYHAEHLHGMCT